MSHPKFKKTKGIIGAVAESCVQETREFPCPHCGKTITEATMIFKRIGDKRAT